MKVLAAEILALVPGILAWGGVSLRDPRLQALVPVRRAAERSRSEEP